MPHLIPLTEVQRCNTFQVRKLGTKQILHFTVLDRHDTSLVAFEHNGENEKLPGSLSWISRENLEQHKYPREHWDRVATYSLTENHIEDIVGNRYIIERLVKQVSL